MFLWKYFLFSALVGLTMGRPVPIVLDQYDVEEMEKLSTPDNMTVSRPEEDDNNEFYEPDYRLLESDLDYTEGKNFFFNR